MRNVSPVGVFIMGSCRGASPSPSGRGWPEGPGEGRLVKNVAHSGPHPPLRGTLSRRERDSLQPLPTIANVQTPGTAPRCDPHSATSVGQRKIDVDARDHCNRMASFDGWLINPFAHCVQGGLDAVRKWIYQPTIEGGHAIAVVTSVNINFTLTN